ncbi:2-oxoglutarate dehydrogenase subunit E1 [Prolixibacter denitrificans]|uniref:oxoglutarate dehydrogenase (succinyl-transferring) n=2 Tax=Prolixibacter denitrificans TaxID=1541063 RepID=A0ABQ0ZL93_9BACT|nr:2-oxoglutarate dehydrogenase subunit E1 [Prolixibacter denitrificans]
MNNTNMDKFSQVGNQEIGAIEDLYKAYLEDPENVDASWKAFFKGFEFARQSWAEAETPEDCKHLDKEFKILNLIHNYRQRGHLFTRTNPVRTRRTYSPTLDIENFGLSEADLDIVFQAGNEIGIGPASLRDIVAHLETTYCESIGVEYLFMRKPEVVKWLRERMEGTKNQQEFTDENRKHIFYHLKLAVGFENFIHKKFVGQKRFSLEGTETLIPAMDAIIERGAELGIEEFVIGMSHRGRLNVLANIVEKPYKNIFKEFYGTEFEEGIALGDVKYHLGYENEVTTDQGHKVKLNLLPNPSHLEAVAPLVEGVARAKLDHEYGKDFKKLAPIVIHGDAAIAGQGVVYETVQMSQLKGYKTGGTIHMVLNNQVGFTTNYLDARSSTYSTDVAKVTRSPVFHVNGDDVEALIFTIKLAMEFRQQFESDIFIDILSYRKYGHNEGDEPRFTQPTLYKAIASHPNPRDLYAEKLIQKGIMTNEEIKKEIDDFNQSLEVKYEESQHIQKLRIERFLLDEYKNYRLPEPSESDHDTDTGYDIDQLKAVAEKMNTLPDDKSFFRKIIKLLNDRKKAASENRLDWAMGELLAYAALLLEGHPVRMGGQDSERGTFAHRHAALVMEATDEKYFPLKHIGENQAPFHIYNSPLNEYAAMGFEYGYALACPKGLTIWEAQFGDFSNVAQVIIDQYISSAGEKWGMMNGLVLMLPHGYEGQGPEHSSGRIERMLAQAAGNNMQVMVPTTPASLFHMLRRHVKWDFRIPMVIFTPKSLLRHPKVISTFEDLANGRFQPLIPDETVKPGKASKLVFTSGKIYYELLERREELKKNDVAIIRIEQLYPFPAEAVRSIIYENKNAKSKLWVQDEPENMGAWPYITRKYPGLNLDVISRPESASPAGGLMEQHKRRLERILEAVFK